METKEQQSRCLNREYQRKYRANKRSKHVAVPLPNSSALSAVSASVAPSSICPVVLDCASENRDANIPLCNPFNLVPISLPAFAISNNDDTSQRELSHTLGNEEVYCIVLKNSS
ncbi:hypothetical protein DSO57_1025584 [Entomophthora muscae]|uniref:Uncharacterized protein n=1 Tax=Entomophthora muscae TaxID=34485 RepID=A0ACC2T252_9FUNG|nr:hypothetical protein DSO57_1025584 [Entomophthora muscae]